MQAGSANLPATLTIGELLPALVAGRDLTRHEAAQLVTAMLAPETPDAQIAAALALLVAKGESSDELAGFADALYLRVLPIAIPPEVLDTAGTGASAVKTFNVSTAASFVIAATGCAIAKHGSRASTSKCGSADVLTALGVRIDCESDTSARCLRELGICFLFAPKYHSALARVAPIRKALGIRTTFNLIGPMVSPGRAQYRLLGVSDEARMTTVAGALAQIGVRRAWVLRGGDGLDEITTSCSTRVLEVRDGKYDELTLSPLDFGISPCPTDAAQAGSVAENAASVRAVLSGQRRDVARDLVVLNAAAALHVRTGDGLRVCAERAQKTIDEGAALKKMEALIAMSHSPEGAAL
jgi:anthranilate phosphoribosyltransferase